MNSSATSDSEETTHQCEISIFLGGTLDHTTPEVHKVLAFIIVMNMITCPITTVLNALIIIAVKTKPRLKTMSNVALACLATTDGIMGMIGQPIFIARTTVALQGEASSTDCTLERLSANVIRAIGTASLFHLALVNVERYIAIKHSLKYINMVTEARLTLSSAVLWIITLLLTVPVAITDNKIYLSLSNITFILCMAIILFCQFVLYRETHRHEKNIAAHQVSVEAREKILKDKKALKLTTGVLFFLVLAYLPLILVRILIQNSVIETVNLAFISLILAIFVAMMNSLINPMFYCVRIRQFRVAFIEIVFRKSNTQAEEVEMRVFGTMAVEAPPKDKQGRRENQNDEQESENNGGNHNNNDEHSNNSNIDGNSNNNNDVNEDED